MQATNQDKLQTAHLRKQMIIEQQRELELIKIEKRVLHEREKRILDNLFILGEQTNNAIRVF